MNVSPQQKQEALDRLRHWMPEWSTVYCVLRHRSRTGMQREIGLVVFRGPLDRLYPVHPNLAAAEVLGMRLNARGDGVVVRGCGMDMGWHLVNNLSRALYGRDNALRAEWI